MSLPLWFTLFTAALVISLTPGAGAVNTMSNSIALGWRRSLWGILGQQLALVIQVIIVALGVGALVAASPGVLTAVRWAGAAYLVYLGLRMLLAKPVPAPEPGHEPLEAETSIGEGPSAATRRRAAGTGLGRHESAWSMLRRGTLVNLLNPKAIVFFLAFIPPFIRTDRPQLIQYVIIGVTVVVVDIIVMWFGFAALAKPLGRLMHSPRGQRTLNTIFGCCFIGVAALLLIIH